MIEDVRISLCSLWEGSFFKMEFYLGLCYTEQKEERYQRESAEEVKR